MSLTHSELAKILLIFFGDVIVLWVLFRFLDAVVELTTIVLISILLVALTLLEFGFFAYILGFVAIYTIAEKYSSAEGSDVVIISIFGGMSHFALVMAFQLFAKEYVRI